MTITINGTTGIAGVDGTAATPALQGNDTDTGIYYGTNLVYMSAGGAQKFQVNSNGIYAPASAAANVATLTDAATITPDLATSNNFTVTLGGNRALANPSNPTVGQSGVIYIVQDGTGSRTLSWGAYWKFPSGAAPTLTTTANAVDAVFYTVRSSTSITVNSLLNIG